MYVYFGSYDFRSKRFFVFIIIQESVSFPSFCGSTNFLPTFVVVFSLTIIYCHSPSHTYIVYTYNQNTFLFSVITTHKL